MPATSWDSMRSSFHSILLGSTNLPVPRNLLHSRPAGTGRTEARIVKVAELLSEAVALRVTQEGR